MDKLAAAVGIHHEYWDLTGSHHVTDKSAKEAVLTAMGVPVASVSDRKLARERLIDLPKQAVLPPVIVLRRTETSMTVTINALKAGRLDWHIRTETGHLFEGALTAETAGYVPLPLPDELAD
ncbi:MAG: hypothetical protein U9N14_05315, partial [Pseudomonadota bacterium]|nr:hypothetical protein [Pseudomonadota bacterium]